MLNRTMHTNPSGDTGKFVTFDFEKSIILVLILVLFFICAAGYSYVTPLWNPPDEERHFAYCEYIARHRRLPSPLMTGEEPSIGQAIHPPLYYTIASLLYRDGENTLAEMLVFDDGPGFTRVVPAPQGNKQRYANKERSAYRMRTLSIVFSAITVGGIYLLALSIFPGNAALASAGALFAAMNPQFLHISASVSNENLSSALSTLYLLALLRYFHSPCRTYHHVITGALLGCMLLAKLSTLFYLPLTAAVLLWVLMRNTKKLCVSLAVIFCTALLVAGWWYVRNWTLTGDPFLSTFLTANQPWAVRRNPFALRETAEIASNTFTSFFGYFGAFQIPLPRIYLLIYGVLMIGGLAGTVLLLRKGALSPFQRRAMMLLFLTLAGGGGTFISFNLSYIGTYMGRYFFPVLAPIAIGTMAGLAALLPVRLHRRLLSLAALLLVILNLTVWGWVLKPAYARTDLVTGADQPLFSEPTCELGPSTVAQTFVSPRDNLAAIRVMFSVPFPLREGKVTFSLAERFSERKILHRITLPLESISDCSRHFFIFPPIQNAKGKAYIFWLAASLPAGNKLALWHEPTDSYGEGHLLINDRPSDGDLYFTTYHFNGVRPSTAWQGRTETVITQGMFVDVRELQLYYEQPKALRERTPTHEKIIRVVNAVQNRNRALQKENQ